MKVKVSGHPGLPVLNSPYGLCGCKATFEGEVITMDVILVLEKKRERKRRKKGSLFMILLSDLSVDSKQRT